MFAADTPFLFCLIRSYFVASGSISNPDQFLCLSKNKVIESFTPSLGPISTKVPFVYEKMITIFQGII